jgi:hypothetical protein
MAQTTKLGTWTLEAADFLRGAIVAMGTSVLTFLQQLFFPAGETPMLDFSKIDWRIVGGVAAAAFLSYMAKNLFTNTKGEVAGITATAPSK